MDQWARLMRLGLRLNVPLDGAGVRGLIAKVLCKGSVAMLLGLFTLLDRGTIDSVRAIPYQGSP